MADNPFTGETRTARLGIDVAGLFDTLRAPASLHRLVMTGKPTHQSVSDFTLKALLDAVLIEAIVHGRYQEVQATLASLFGVALPNGKPAAPATPAGKGRAPALPPGYRQAEEEALGLGHRRER